MAIAQTGVVRELERLREATSSDFSALARIGPDRDIRWSNASGHLSERYKRLMQRPGKGLAGTVVKIGRPYVLDESERDRQRLMSESPIMAVERLLAAYAVPIVDGSDVVGVLLVGHRASRTYTPEEKAAIADAARRIGPMLLQERPEKTPELADSRDDSFL